jgi:hypothetical protein
MAHAAEPRHEESDVNIRAILAFGASLVIATAIICFLVWLLFAYFQSRESSTVSRDFPLAAEQQNRMPPEPRLQTDPKGDLRDLRQREDALLSSYGWIDKDRGVVRIPIEEAMKRTIQRGLPSRATTGTK